jgi:hypothetical protein
MVEIKLGGTAYHNDKSITEAYLVMNGHQAPNCSKCYFANGQRYTRYNEKGERIGMGCSEMNGKGNAVIDLELENPEVAAPTVNELLQGLVSEGQTVPCIEP